MIILFTGFFNTLNFLAQLWIADLLFSGKRERREHFWPRCIVLGAAAVLAGSFTYLVLFASGSWLLYSLAYYLLLFLYGVMATWGIYAEPFSHALDQNVTGYLVQNLASQFSQTITWNFVFSQKDYLEQYEDSCAALPFDPADWKMLFSGEFWQGAVSRTTTLGTAGVVGKGLPGVYADLPVFTAYLLTLPLTAACYAVLYFALSRRMRRTNYTDTTRRKLLVLSLAALVVVVGLSSYRDVHAAESFSLMLASRLLSIMCCVLLLVMKTGILELNTVEQESETLQRLRVQEREQYEQKKETIDLINIKCHDMRHQIERMEQTGTQGSLEEMKKLIRVYDSTVRTGNETLDTILTEQSLVCGKYGIRLSCIADGSLLNFMSVSDICSLFGNALDNAIQAVEQLPDPDDRIISLRVEEKGSMLLVRVENSYTGPLSFDGDLPRTTKGDNGYHGFGLKSIRMVAEKYGGVMKISTGEEFVLTVMIPKM